MSKDRGIPLAALRADLDRGWPPGARWTTSGGIAQAVLEQPIGSRISYRLRAKSRLRLEGETEALGEGRATISVRVCVRDDTGAEAFVYVGKLRRVRSRTFPSRLRVEAEFEAENGVDLSLEVSGPIGEAIAWRGLQIVPERESEPVAGTSTNSGARPTREPERPAAPPASPRFSVLTPVHDPPPDVLAETIASVRAQRFEDWELCLVDDGSSDPAVREMMARAAAEDPRIRLLRREQAGGISAATNAALEMASGEYVALLDHDDVLVPEALAAVEETLHDHPATDMLYSDEELLDETGPLYIFAKPHWSPELLRSQMYTCHLGVYRRSLALEVGGFRSDFDGSQDFDFALRCSERTERVRHIPRVLYRWRVHAGSSAGSTQAKPAAYPAARRAIAEHLERTGVDGEALFGPWQGIYRVVHRLPDGAEISVGVVGEAGPSASFGRGLADGAASGAPAARAVIGSSAAAIVAAAQDADVVVVAATEFEPLSRLWLARLAGFALQPGVAAVGARTVAPDGRVEDGARAVEDGVAVPLLFGAAAGDPGPLGIGVLPANAAVVAGLVALSGEALRSLGGPVPELGELAVADFCLRAVSRGLRVVSTPDVLVRRLGPAPVADLDQLARFRRRWGGEFAEDPYLGASATWPAPLAATG
jgi:glycosyltransferase involved in cell wall biosynthesis